MVLLNDEDQIPEQAPATMLIGVLRWISGKKLPPLISTMEEAFG